MRFQSPVSLTTAIWGLRSYRTTALLLASALLGAVFAAVPVATLFGLHGDLFGFRPSIPPWQGGDLGLPWITGVIDPTVAQQEAVSRLGSLLLLTLSETIVVGLAAILGLGATRVAERRIERLVVRAVGATRRTQLATGFVELAVIGAIPALAGNLLGFAAAHTTAATWPGSMAGGTGHLTLLAQVPLILGFAGVLLGPAFVSPRQIKEGQMHEPLPTFPAVLQIALCLIVLATGSLLSSRARELATVGSEGAGSGTVVSISLGPETPSLRAAQYRRLLHDLARVGMRSVSLTSPGTLTGLGYVAMVLTECGACTEGGLNLSVRLKPATHRIVSSDTFRLIGLPVLSGRGFTAADDYEAPRVAVVSRSLAGREFQEGKPIGRRIHTGDDDAEGSIVVGVVDDRLPLGLGGSLQPRYGVYVSALQHPPTTADLLIRGPFDHRVLTKTLETVIGPTGRYTISSERIVRQAAIAPVQWFGRLFALQGWAMVGLALFGVITVMRLWVGSLVGEIAIRLCVGARRSRILLWILGRAIGVWAKGIAGGVWFGMTVWSGLPDLVAGVKPWNLPALLPSAVLLLGVVVCAVLSPAWYFSRGSPAEVMRSSA
jgi:MacB-like periplasmic core domain